MATNGFKPEEKLYGSANFNSWKAKLTTILDETNLDDIVFNVIEEPTTNAGRLAYKRKQGKARRIAAKTKKFKKPFPQQKKGKKP